MLFRAEVRTVALELLTAAVTQAGAEKTSSKDTPIMAGNTANIVVYTDDNKVGLGGTPPQFRTMVLTTVEIIAEGKTKDEAETLLDSLCDTVETALFSNPRYVRLFEQIEGVDTRTEYRGLNARLHTFAAVMEIKGYATEIFEPSITDTLKGLNVYVDSVNVVDREGTYAPPFDYPVQPAPRILGPEGRPEASFSVDFSPYLATQDGQEIETEGGENILAP